uniref:Uncharacterized protein n=1 Tax=Vitis vinifera TaxID=29760 RepID=F6HPZ2_VITVI
MTITIFTTYKVKLQSTGFFPALIGGDSLSRYHTDFHEIEVSNQTPSISILKNFSRVFKVLKRIDGCMYAVKHSTRPLHQDTERRKALMEVQALAALGLLLHFVITAYPSRDLLTCSQKGKSWNLCIRLPRPCNLHMRKEYFTTTTKITQPIAHITIWCHKTSSVCVCCIY